MIAFFATASIGGVWSLCAPDMGTAGRARPLQADRAESADRLRRRQLCRQGLRPDAGGAGIARGAAERAARSSCTTISAPPAASPATVTFADTISRDDARTKAFEPEWMPFDHPLWIVYSSGTTGLPKPIVHGHGGIIVDVACAERDPQRRRLQLRAEFVRRALSLVLVDRLGDVELPDQRPAQRHHLLHL